ncbi:MAG TPA: YetF domain-containing protein [Candidatus Xenobia bacterium]|jgi:uncharacterized membrane protein YcaP (DUF421 family)
MDRLATLFQTNGSLLLVIGQTVGMYLFLVVGLRVLGRRQMAQLNPGDQLVLLLLGSAVETSLVAGNTSLAAGLVSCGTLLCMNAGLNALLVRHKHFRHWMLGPPILVVHNGHYVDANLSRLSLTQADVDHALRRHGFDKPDEVRYAVMEPDGDVNVVPRGQSKA